MLIRLQKIVAFILVIMVRSKIVTMIINQVVMKDKYIESHFDFKLDGNINGKENGQSK